MRDVATSLSSSQVSSMKKSSASSNMNSEDYTIPRDAKAPDVKKLMQRLAEFQQPDTKRSIIELAVSFTPLFGLLYLSHVAYATSPWLTVFISALASVFVVRVFMIQHDCGHGSFFKSRTLNDNIGRFCSCFTMIPYLYWRKQHALHHAGNGNLDRRGYGDIDTYTVREYLSLSPFQQFCYRVLRNPFCMLLIGPFFFVFYQNRLAYDVKKLNESERASLRVTNMCIILGFLALGYWLGFPKLFCIMGPLIYVASFIGIWLFYVQHQFEHAYWEWDDKWSFFKSAMQGSSFYNLPKFLHWMTSNIGYHHIHHLSPLIPSYRLPDCSEAIPSINQVPTLTLRSSIKTIFLSVWDEEQNRLISFKELKEREKNKLVQIK